MNTKRVFARILAPLSLFFIATNSFAGDYTNCSAKYYTGCLPRYYMTLNGVYNGTAQTGNYCSDCPSDAEFCPGHTYAPAYKVTLNASGGSGGTSAIYRIQNVGWFSSLLKNTTTEATTVSAIGTQITTITKPTKTGYTFKGFYDAQSGGTQTITSAGVVSASNAYGTATWYAQWTANTYTIKYNSDGGSSVSDTTCTYGQNCTVSSTKPTKTGYTFNGWKYGSTTYQSGATVSNLTSTNGGSVTFTAQWTANTYTIKYNSDGGSSVSDTTCTYGQNCTVSSTKPTKTGYTFAGWKYDSTTYQAGATITTSLTSTNGGSVTFTAQWTANTFTLKHVSDGTVVREKTCTYDSACTVTATVPTKTGYTFDGWLYNDKTYTSGQDVKNLVNTNGTTVTLTAQWTVISKTCSAGQYFNVTECADCTSGYYCPNGSKTYTYNGNIQGRYTCPANSSTNGKTGQASCTCNTGYNYNGGTTATTNACMANTYTIKYNTNGGDGSIADTTCTYGQNCTISSTKPTKTGYTFTGWQYVSTTYQSGATIDTNLTSTNGAVLEFVAQWTPVSYSIIYNSQSGLSLPSTNCTYDSSCTINETKLTKTGYTFAGWKYGDETYQPGDTVINLTNNGGSSVTLTGQWTPITFTVIYVSNGGSGTSMENTICTYDTDCYITANTYTRTGYTFKNWANSDKSQYFEDGANLKNASSTQGAGLFLYAQWEPITYTVRYDANGGSGSMTDKQCVYDTDCKLDANTFTNTGHSFVGWLYGGIKYQDQETLPNLTTENGAVLEFVAQWSKNARTCEAGKYLNGDTCETCPADHYCTGGAWEYNGDKQGLEKCPANSSTNGKTGQASCTCNTGYNHNGGTIATTNTCEANTYTIKYNTNGGDGSIADTTCTYGQNCTVSSTKPTKTGYTFAGWQYGSTTYQSGSIIDTNLTSTNGAVLEFVAQWTPITYTIRYDADGGYGYMEDTTCTYDQLCYLRENTYTKTGHRFVHWWFMDYMAGEYVTYRPTQQDEVVVAKAYWLPIQIPCPAGQYLDGLYCIDCEDKYYCEGSEAEGWSNGWSYDGGIHGRKDCPVTTETYGAAENLGFLDVLATAPHTSIEECRATFVYVPEWLIKTQDPNAELATEYDPQANNRGVYFVSCDYNSDTKQYDSNCTGFPLSCGAGYVSSTNVDLATDFEDLSKNLYYANSPQDAIEKTCVPVGRNNWSPSGQECIGLPDDEVVFCLYEKSLEKNACPDGGITLTDTAGAITDCLKNDVECATELGDGIKTCSYDEATGGYNNCGECSVDSCKSGYYMNNGVCTTCPAGSACSDNNITTCGANTWSTVGGAQCNACPANSSTNGATGQTQCVCNDGYTTNGKFDGPTTTTTQDCIRTDINVTYDVNGGNGALGGHTCPAGTQCTLLTPDVIGNHMYRAGYVFIGWGDKANATTPVNPVFNTDVTLYAIWNACAAGTYKTADAALDAQCSACQVLGDKQYNATNDVASTSPEQCFTTCANKKITNATLFPKNTTAYYPTVCEYENGITDNGNPCKFDGDTCKEVSCKPDNEMINGNCQPCNREHATEYKTTGNCEVAKCRYGYHPNGQSCQSNVIECQMQNAKSASQKWDEQTGAYGVCTITECEPGFHIVANACQPDEQTCELEHGIGWREWDDKKNDWGKCIATQCEPGYTNDPDLTNESWEQCGRCNNMYGAHGERVVSSYVRECEIASCMYQGEHFILENNECRDICETYSDETGSRKWNGNKCVHTCNEGYTNW